MSSPIEVGSISGEVILFSTARITLMDVCNDDDQENKARLMKMLRIDSPLLMSGSQWQWSPTWLLQWHTPPEPQVNLGRCKKMPGNTWKRRPSGEKVFGPRSYSDLPNNPVYLSIRIISNGNRPVEEHVGAFEVAVTVWKGNKNNLMILFML